MDFSVTALITDFALASALIFISQLLRAKVDFIKKLLIPSSLFAGLLALVLGHQGLALISFSSGASSYTYALVVILFGGLFIGNKKAKNIKASITNVSDSFFMTLGAEVGGFGIAILLGALLIPLLFYGLDPAFAVLMPAGFTGGHAYAALIGGTVAENSSLTNALEIAQTFATIGLLCAIFFGMIVIRYGIKKGYTNYLPEMSSLPNYMRSGFYSSSENAPVIGKQTACSVSVESLTWHISLFLMAAGAGYYLDAQYRNLGYSFTLPLSSLSMFCGVLINIFLRTTKLDYTVDKDVMNRLSSGITDYLVFFGVSTIKISVVAQYWLPILIFCCIGLSYSFFLLFFISRRTFRDHWFERGVFVFGWTTGVVSMGITLLRVVDPDFKTTTLADYSAAYAVVSILDVLIVTFIPIFVVQGFDFVTGAALTALFAVLMLLCIYTNKKLAN